MNIDDLLEQLAEKIATRVEERLKKAAPQPSAPSQSEWLTAKQAAALLKLGSSTLESYRRRGIGPKWSKPGTQVRYRRADLEAYLSQKGGAR